MAESQKRQPPAGPSSVGRHGVPVSPIPATRTPADTVQDQDQTAPLSDHSRRVRPADSSTWLSEEPAFDLEPLAGNAANTGDLQLATDAGDTPHTRCSDWAADSTAPSMAVSAQTTPRNPVFRNVLLLLLLAVLSGIAYWTPEGLQTVVASTVEMLLSTDIPQARTTPGPGPLVGQLDVISTPSGVELFVDDELQGITPAQLVLNAGTHEVTLVSSIGTVRRTVRVRPGHRTLYSEAIFDGALVISSAVDVEVRIDGDTFDASAGHELVLAAGSYQLELLNPDDGAHTEHTVEIFPGQVTTLDTRAPVGNDR